MTVKAYLEAQNKKREKLLAELLKHQFGTPAYISIAERIKTHDLETIKNLPSPTPK